MDRTVTTGGPMAAVAGQEGDQANEVLRDITRGGLTGLVVGILLAGVGGRLVMRLAALIVPESARAVTENGNVIGTVTFAGSMGLVVFVGLVFGVVAGSLWVVISPWLPAATSARVLLTIPIAVALGTRGLIDDRNRDFAILRHDPLVIASLVILVALFGPALVVVDRWLDGRLPHAGRGDGRIVAGYAIVTAIGLLLTAFLVIPIILGSDIFVAGVALVLVGFCTLASWWFRIERDGTRPPRLVVIARGALAVAVVAGLAVAIREIAGVLDLT